MRSSPRTLRAKVVLLVVIGVAVAGLPGCGKQPEKPAAGGPGAAGAPKGRPPVPVLVAVAEQADVPVELRALGSVEPIQSSPVHPQITGTITEVAFREGGMVKAGQVLFRLDRRPLEATLRQLQANLAQNEAQMRSAEAQTQSTGAQVRNAEAQLKNAESQAGRYEELVAKELVAREQYDQRVTNLDAARAALDAARASALASRAALDVARAAAEATKATIENAKLQLDYTVVTAPVSGQAGSLLADKGDLVKANDATLVVVNQIQPILVRFTVPEARLPEVQRYRAAGTLKVRVTPAGAGAQPREGRLAFLDNTVDKTTGTIALKAEFDNADHALWPGQFIDVSLVLTMLEKVVVIPSQAVQTGQQGTYVFVVDDAGAAAVRPITPGAAADEKTVVATGLAAGETVVTDGQLRLTPGATVVRKTGLSSPPAAGAAALSPEKPR
ncbi:MAG: efflux RND transporter periplasmic adaptor subunit [Candidatus Methylomirabilia bacterium]